MRLRRAVVLFTSPEPPSATRVASLERALFGGLGQLSTEMERLARLEAPGIDSLDPMLLRRFVSEQGVWRIEVMPRDGTGQLSFAAAIRRVVPEAAGEPMVSLSRNEIIHHETVLAMAMALALVVFLVLAALRNVTAWVLSLAPAAAFITLTAAVTVLLGVSLNASMLAGISAAIAVLIASSMRVAEHLSARSRSPATFGMALRAAILPLLALAAAVGPLALSSRPSVAEVGGALAMLLVLAAVLVVVLVPAMGRWFDAMQGHRPRRSRRR